MWLELSLDYKVTWYWVKQANKSKQEWLTQFRQHDNSED
jgi:hypothetical protein